VEQAVKEAGITMEVASYKRGATDFSSQVARLKSADVGLVVLGTQIRETVAVVNEAQKSAWKPEMLVTASAYTPDVITLGGANVEGLYGLAQTPIPYADTASPALKSWMERYQAKYHGEANPQAVMGYQVIALFIEGARNAGRDLTRDSLIHGLEQIHDYRDIFGTAPMSFGPERRLATNAPILFEVKGGRWVKVADF
jgi:ABC-type branched-subunit amino acid transport system substrate-binding protein